MHKSDNFWWWVSKSAEFTHIHTLNSVKHTHSPTRMRTVAVARCLITWKPFIEQKIVNAVSQRVVLSFFFHLFISFLCFPFCTHRMNTSHATPISTARYHKDTTTTVFISLQKWNELSQSDIQWRGKILSDALFFQHALIGISGKRLGKMKWLSTISDRQTNKTKRVESILF